MNAIFATQTCELMVMLLCDLLSQYGDDVPDRPTQGFRRRRGHGGAHYQEVDPDEIFNMFFGGGLNGNVLTSEDCILCCRLLCHCVCCCAAHRGGQGFRTNFNTGGGGGGQRQQQQQVIHFPRTQFVFPRVDV